MKKLSITGDSLLRACAEEAHEDYAQLVKSTASTCARRCQDPASAMRGRSA